MRTQLDKESRETDGQATFSASMEFKLQESHPFQSKHKSGEEGIWTVDSSAHILQADYTIDHIEICCNRQGIRKMCALADKSILCHVENGYNYSEFLAHFSAEGKALRRMHLEGDVYLLDMLNDNIAVFIRRKTWSSKQHVLVQWNLQTDDKIQLLMQNSVGYMKYSKMWLFPQTGMFCIGFSLNMSTLIIQYYNYPLESQGNRPIYTVQIDTLKNANGLFSFFKLDDFSMVAVQHAGNKQDVNMIRCDNYMHQKKFSIRKCRIPCELTQIMCMRFIHTQTMFIEIEQTNNYIGAIWQYEAEENQKKQQNGWRQIMTTKQQHETQILGHFAVSTQHIIQHRDYRKQAQSVPVYYLDLEWEQLMIIENSPLSKAKHVDPYRCMLYYPQYAPELEYYCIENRERWIHRKKMSVRKVQWPRISNAVRSVFFLECLISDASEDLLDEAFYLLSNNKQ